MTVTYLRPAAVPCPPAKPMGRMVANSSGTPNTGVNNNICSVYSCILIVKCACTECREDK
jgi:hypothetical protein